MDGDSASSTEIYALLSALADVPIRQDIAVTGSVNQQGEIQAIGGVNQKIEGFYSACRVKGFTGRQGVMIPHENVEDLMLREEVIDAVREGKFHIYAVHTIEQGIEILTGVAAGARDASGAPLPPGKYDPDSVFGLADARLRQMAQLMKEFE